MADTLCHVIRQNTNPKAVNTEYQPKDGVYQLKFSRLAGHIFPARRGDAGNRLMLQQEGVRGPLRHRRQLHAHQHASVKREPSPKKNNGCRAPQWSSTHYTVVAALT